MKLRYWVSIRSFIEMQDGPGRTLFYYSGLYFTEVSCFYKVETRVVEKPELRVKSHAFLFLLHFMLDCRTLDKSICLSGPYLPGNKIIGSIFSRRVFLLCLPKLTSNILVTTSAFIITLGESHKTNFVP